MTNYLDICLVIVYYYMDGTHIKTNFLLIIIHYIFFALLDSALEYYKIKINETSSEEQKKETNIVA